MNIRPSLIADVQAAILRQPCQRALRYPAIPPQPRAALNPPPRDAWNDVSRAQCCTTEAEIVRLICMQLLWSLARSPAPPRDRRDRIEHRHEQLRVLPVRSTHPYGERDALPVDHNMPLRARFAAIRRVRSALFAPFFARMLALSKLARDQSIWSAPPRRLSNARCRRPQTSALCQSRKRRQQVMPLPQPISCGSISQGMPLLRTKMMPVRAAWLDTGGRPPFGLGGPGGRSGAIAFHSWSLTNRFVFIPPTTSRPVPGFC